MPQDYSTYQMVITTSWKYLAIGSISDGARCCVFVENLGTRREFLEPRIHLGFQTS